jgi:hypothetical protein
MGSSDRNRTTGGTVAPGARLTSDGSNASLNRDDSDSDSTPPLRRGGGVKVMTLQDFLGNGNSGTSGGGNGDSRGSKRPNLNAARTKSAPPPKRSPISPVQSKPKGR